MSEELQPKKRLNRRKFFRISAIGGLGAAISPMLFKNSYAATNGYRADDEKPKTNIEDALKYPRNEKSMPGKLPAKVVRVNHKEAVKDNQIELQAAREMVKKAVLSLTGAATIAEAWKMFVSPGEKIGLKVNPVAGKQLSTSIEVTKAIVEQLEQAGIQRKDIMIWDRREFQLHEAGFTEENFPGITIRGTEQKDKNDSYHDEDGVLYGEKMIDKEWFYWADVEGEYRPETMPYMINEGKHSYFSKICTQELDKIINVPILKNAGSSITLALKNLAYGSISNTGRLHQQLWGETCAEVCAFPPLRDKVVLNIVDGIKGCFNGGPGANPQFFTNYNTVLAATDPVAIDRIGYEIVLKKRIEEGLQEEDKARSRAYMDLAQKLQLGTADIDKIDLTTIDL